MYHETVSKIEQMLTEKGISFTKFEHAPVRTSEEAAALRPDYTLSQGAKALIVRVKKNSEKYFVMIVVPGDQKFDSGKVKAVLRAADIRFATPEEVGTITNGVLPGGVPPFGNLWGLPVLVDQSLFANDDIIFNAGDRSVSISIPSAGWREVVDPQIAEII